MCKNNKLLLNFDPPGNEDQIRAASVSQLLDSLVMNMPPEDREQNAINARERTSERARERTRSRAAVRFSRLGSKSSAPIKS